MAERDQPEQEAGEQAPPELKQPEGAVDDLEPDEEDSAAVKGGRAATTWYK
ncbi:MAG: hypothetical protein WD844_01920 [Thermoleophilaceae bacterium]